MYTILFVLLPLLLFCEAKFREPGLDEGSVADPVSIQGQKLQVEIQQEQKDKKEASRGHDIWEF